jgi:hypothetical protein
MPLLKYTSVSRTAARALEEFSDAFRNALVITEPDLWAAKFGLVLVTDALKTTFPLPLDAAGYHEFKGDIKYQSLYSRALSMKTKKWQGGVEELAEIVEAPDFIDWLGQPEKYAREWRRMPNTLVAQMLEANPILDFYRDPDTGTAGSRRLFADDHPFNVLKGTGTFDNDRSTTVAEILNGTFFSDVKTYARSIKGPNGQSMGLSASGGTIICNGTREELIDEALKQDSVIKAISDDGKITPPEAAGTVVAAAVQANRHKGTMSYLVADELTSASDDYLYVVLNGNPECYPWVSMQGASPEEIISDKNDAKYKEHLKVSIAYVGDANVAAALPHRIVRYRITG